MRNGMVIRPEDFCERQDITRNVAGPLNPVAKANVIYGLAELREERRETNRE